MLSVHCTRACEKWHHICRHPHLFYYYERMKRMFCLSDSKSLLFIVPLGLFTQTHKNNENMSQPRDANLDFRTFHCLLCSHSLDIGTFLVLWWHSCVFTVHFGYKKKNGTHKMHITKTWHLSMQGRFFVCIWSPTPEVWLTHFICSTKP